MEVISWDEYFMATAKLAAKRSKDPNTKVGAAIVIDKKIVSIGYNGMPNGDDTFPWEREGDKIDTKYSYVIHAEINAILNTTTLPRDFTIYTSLFPCSNCAKFLVQAGVKEVIYEGDKYDGTEDDKIAKFILEKAKIKCTKTKPFEITI